MARALRPVRRVGGELEVPGDKSIAHRAALLSILSRGPIKVLNFPFNADCRASLKAAGSMGVTIEENVDHLILTPPASIDPAPETIIDCANSGTTARLLSGILAGLDCEVTISGDESLSSRPMMRIIDPLSEMGAEFFADDGKLPMRIRGKKLLPFEYRLPVASAQVKSAVLLAGLASSCSVTIREDSLTRDHTELMISELGEGMDVRRIRPVKVTDPVDPRKSWMEMPEDFKKEIKLSSQARIDGGEISIPGDISTAAFFFAAAAISGETVTVRNLGLNPTRTAFLEYLKRIGCQVSIANKQVISSEPRGDVTVVGGKLKPRKISGDTTVALIDEIPIVAVIAAFTRGTTVIRNAAELKVKESDRLAAIADNLGRMGIKCGLLDDGLAIEGKPGCDGAEFASHGDHRIAMAFSIASLFLIGPSSIDDDTVVAVSCPEFYDLLDRIAK